MPVTPAIEEALRKAGVVWVDLGEGPQVAWHLWHDGAVWLVCGGLEQHLPGADLAADPAPQHTTVADPNPTVADPNPTATVADPHVAPTPLAAVTVRAPDAAVHGFTAEVSPVVPGSEEWLSVVPLLHEKRLNPPDGEAQPDRWARESLVLRLTPT